MRRVPISYFNRCSFGFDHFKLHHTFKAQINSQDVLLESLSHFTINTVSLKQTKNLSTVKSGTTKFLPREFCWEIKARFSLKPVSTVRKKTERMKERERVNEMEKERKEDQEVKREREVDATVRCKVEEEEEKTVNEKGTPERICFFRRQARERERH